jgi:curli production assembly/transport component CsgG/holdfast attachment protein HfaB
MIPLRATISLLALLAASACAQGPYPETGVKPAFSFPVTNNDTPYSQCLTELGRLPGNNLPVFAVGEVADRTGQFQQTSSNNSTVVTQGATEMVMSALYKTHKARLVERYDLRVPLAEMKMAEQNLLGGPAAPLKGSIRGSDFVLVGALTELNYNIVSDGAQLAVSGIGGGGRTVIINVALDLRVINARTFDVAYVSTLQKQIMGYEVEANIFRFFGTSLVELNAGRIQNEPLQLGVRSVTEMAVYQIMTDFLGLPSSPQCALVTTDHMDRYLKNGPVSQSNEGVKDERS